ncbi:hypothetical protein CB1_001473002, partial [Camelus ferus]
LRIGAHRIVAAPFPTLAQLEQRGRMLLEVLSYLNKRPCWLHSKHLMTLKAVRLETWLVEGIFGRGGACIPHIQLVSQTVPHVDKWDPEGHLDASWLCLGRGLILLVHLGEGLVFARDPEEQIDLISQIRGLHPRSPYR